MRAQRRGTNLKIEIRLALLSLGEDPYQKLTGTVAELEQRLKNLRARQRKQGLLK